MQLVSSNLSPYASRVRAQIAAKGLDVGIVPPDPPLGSDAFKAQFALGQIPVLRLDDGGYVSESWAIMNYLEDLFPANSLRPADPLARAQMGMIQGAADQHLRDSIRSLFFRLGARDADNGAGEDIAEAKVQLLKFERLLSHQPDFERREMHIGDIAAVTSIFFLRELAGMLGVDAILAQTPRVDAWWSWMAEQRAIARTIDEMQTALAERAG